MRSLQKSHGEHWNRLRGVGWERGIGTDLNNCNTEFLYSFHLCFALVSLYLEIILLSSTWILVFS